MQWRVTQSLVRHGAGANSATRQQVHLTTGVAFKNGDRFSSLAEVMVFIEPARCFVAEVNGEIVGTICHDAIEEHGEFGPLAVAPAATRRGVARALVGHLEGVFAAAGASESRLCIVDCRTDLPPFYTKLGYTQFAKQAIDRTLPAYKDNMATVYKDIHFLRFYKTLSPAAGV